MFIFLESDLGLGSSPGEGSIDGNGFVQKEGMGFPETVSPTPVPLCIWMSAVTALYRDWVLNHWDIEQDSIQSEIDREIFLILPDGCVISSER